MDGEGRLGGPRGLPPFIVAPNCIRWIGSPHKCSRRDHVPIAVILHVMDGTMAGADAWFNNPTSNVSAHYGLPKSAAEPPHHYVREAEAAWHAGVRFRPTWPLLPPRMINVNWVTLGLEVEGWTGEPWTPYQTGLAVWFLRKFWRDHGVEPVAGLTVVRHSAVNALHGGCPGPGCPFEAIVAEARRLGPLAVHDGFLPLAA